jgi:putative membrane protein
VNDDADPRYSLANERTFLAWIRTALGFLAAGAGVVAVDLPWPDPAVRALAVLLALAGTASAVAAWRRWAAVEAAIVEGRPAPRLRGHAGLSLVVGLVSVLVVVLIML